jgi:hypothetical protein
LMATRIDTFSPSDDAQIAQIYDPAKLATFASRADIISVRRTRDYIAGEGHEQLPVSAAPYAAVS